MSYQSCLGCGAQIDEVICCDPCWDRVPTNLPGQPRWRSRLRGARQTRDWPAIDRIIVAVHAWLTAHPREVSA